MATNAAAMLSAVSVILWPVFAENSERRERRGPAPTLGSVPSGGGNPRRPRSGRRLARTLGGRGPGGGPRGAAPRMAISTHNPGLEGRLQLPGLDLLPVDAAEERVVADVRFSGRRAAQTLRRLLSQELTRERYGGR